jgi:hypothetical protein
MTQDFNAFLSNVQSRQSFSNLCPAVHGSITTQCSLLADICEPTKVVMTIIPEGLNLIQDAMTDTGMEHLLNSIGLMNYNPQNIIIEAPSLWYF